MQIVSYNMYEHGEFYTEITANLNKYYRGFISFCL